MKKTRTLVLLMVLGTAIQAQPKIGLTFSPSVVLNRVKFQPDYAQVTSKGSAIRFKVGLEVDFNITDTYVFSTGLIYAPKKAGYIIDPLDTPAQEEAYKSQYLQVPLTMKLYTSEVVPDIKGFFQLGILAEIKVFSEPLDNTYTLIRAFKPYDASFVFGIGFERDSGATSVVYASVVYNRGLINIISKLGENQAAISDGLISKLDMISLQLGIKF